MMKKVIEAGFINGSYFGYQFQLFRLRVQVKIELRDGPKGPVLSITGDILNGTRIISCGQIHDIILDALDLGIMTNMNAHLDGILSIWERWHLNDLNAGCEHQRKSGWNHCEEDMIGKPCPECGYKYGSAWIYEQLPEDVIEFVRSL